jgi:hypothetical protein
MGKLASFSWAARSTLRQDLDVQGCLDTIGLRAGSVVGTGTRGSGEGDEKEDDMWACTERIGKEMRYKWHVDPHARCTSQHPCRQFIRNNRNLDIMWPEQ